MYLPNNPTACAEMTWNNKQVDIRTEHDRQVVGFKMGQNDDDVSVIKFESFSHDNSSQVNPVLLSNVQHPVSELDAATKGYVDIRVPAWTEADEGKVLKIVNGVPTWASIGITSTDDSAGNVVIS
jgi:hypothetical protein